MSEDERVERSEDEWGGLGGRGFEGELGPRAGPELTDWKKLFPYLGVSLQKIAPKVDDKEHPRQKPDRDRQRHTDRHRQTQTDTDRHRQTDRHARQKKRTWLAPPPNLCLLCLNI